MKAIKFTALALALGSTSVLAEDCAAPQAPELPDGASATMEQLLAGQKIEVELPIFTSPLPSHGILTPLRRMGQRFIYFWYYLDDELF